MTLTPYASQLTLVEKYRPRTIDECILPTHVKEKLYSYRDSGKFPSLIFTGGPGVGKTTATKALAHELNADYLFINASMTGIDDLRTTIQQFAATVSMFGDGRKIVHLDEADNLTHHFQPALRAFIEQYASNCVFILTVNYINKLIPALRDSRFHIIEFKVPVKEKAELAGQTYKRILSILDMEKITYDKEVVATLIKRYFPDIRRILNEIDGESTSGTLSISALASNTEDDWTELYRALKDKQFNEIRKWVGIHSDIDNAGFFRKLYVDLVGKLTEDTAAVLILLLARYQYQAAFAADAEINNTACLVEIMAEAVWK